jgi:uncharacterized damage-inducible protein DinB
MKSILSFYLITLFIPSSLFAQEEKLPYFEIPNYPDLYAAGTVAARVVDGLGFRYYWATEGLRAEDLSYKPNADARSTEETLFHIYDLTLILANTTQGIPTETGGKAPQFSFEELRKRTLENIKTASDRLKSIRDDELDKSKMIFKGANGTTEFPFWNLLNGPIDDALWHVGQVVSFRRSSGNPFSDKVSVLMGKIRE